MPIFQAVPQAPRCRATRSAPLCTRLLRIAQGMDALFVSALNGKNGMPARGTCGNCSDDEIKATVKEIVGKSK